jgi:RNA polymerase sigma-70 factor, ECF subfamily
MSVSANPLDADGMWQDFHARLLAFIARRMPDRDSAEDVLQEVMLRVHRHAGELERSSAAGAWVHQIARNAIADHYRRAAVRRERPAGVDLDRDEAPVPEPPAAELRSELAACLSPLLGRLPATHREALTLTELEGLTQASAAARLGLSTSGMKSRVQRARAQLGELLVACCEIELDSRGGITSYQPRRAPCDCRSPTPADRTGATDAQSADERRRLFYEAGGGGEVVAGSPAPGRTSDV